jgi:hypothetical protein
MRYAVLMYTDPARTKAMTEGELSTVLDKHEKLRDELTASGELLGGAGLVFPEETTVLRWRDGQVSSATGPLTASEEQLSAYYVIDCASRERASAISERVLDFHVTAVELREIHDSADPPARSG